MKHARRLGLAAALACIAAATTALPGDMTFKRVAKTSDYACSFVSREDCDRPGGPTFTLVKQLCTAKTVKGEIVITSTIDRILDVSEAVAMARKIRTLNGPIAF